MTMAAPMIGSGPRLRMRWASPLSGSFVCRDRLPPRTRSVKPAARPAGHDGVAVTNERELSAGLHGRVSGRAGIAYRVARVAWRVVAACLRVRVRVEGLEHLPPSGGFIVAGVPHRTWVDPFLLWGWLPAEPRLVFFGDARTMGRSPLRRAVLRLVGGVIPIPTAHRAGAVELHIAAADRGPRRGGRVLPVSRDRTSGAAAIDPAPRRGCRLFRAAQWRPARSGRDRRQRRAVLRPHDRRARPAAHVGHGARRGHRAAGARDAGRARRRPPRARRHRGGRGHAGRGRARRRRAAARDAEAMTWFTTLFR